VVIVDGGTTTAAMIGFLPADLSCTVVTHSPGIAVALVDHPRIEVILLGGKVFKHSVVAVGAETLARMARINADLFFMGVTGVHPRAGFTTGDYEEAGIKRALAARAAETVVMASREKLNAASAFAIGELSLASTLIVDGNPTPRCASSWCRAAWRSSPFSGSADGARRLIAAGRPALQLVAQVRRGALNGQGIGGGIPEYAFAQQHRVEVNG
jgi:DeoR/GlpR family transcriptional regulator of sugar metabolism